MCLEITAYIPPVGGNTHRVIAWLGTVIPVVNMAGPGLNKSSETDGGKFDDREHSNVTEVIYSGSDHNYDSRDEGTVRFRQGQEEVRGVWASVIAHLRRPERVLLQCLPVGVSSKTLQENHLCINSLLSNWPTWASEAVFSPGPVFTGLSKLKAATASSSDLK